MSIGIVFDEDLFDEESRQNTPERVKRMMEEFRRWRNWELDRGVFEYKGYNDLVVESDIEFFSFCSHHILPFYGVVHIAYLPNGYVLGLSKLARVVRKFASKPQLQERMTHEIADYLYQKIPNVQGIMVIVEAEHLCMKMRGVRTDSRIITSAVRGEIPKEEVLELLKISGR